MTVSDKLLSIAENTPAVTEKLESIVGTARGITAKAENVYGIEHDVKVELSSKNLLNLDGREVVNFGDYTNSTKRIFPGGRGIILNFAPNNYYSGNDSNEVFNITKNSVSYETITSYYGIGLDVKLSPNTQYIFSYTEKVGGFLLTEYDADGNYINNQTLTNGAITTSPTTDWGVIVIRASEGTVSVTNPQFEYGTTATEYDSYVGDLSGPDIVTVPSRNLFDLNRTLGTLNGYEATTVRSDFEFDKYYTGYVRSNLYGGSGYSTTTIVNGVVTVYSNNAFWGCAMPLKAKPGATYTINCEMGGDNPYIAMAFYDSEGNYINNVGMGTMPRTFTTPDNCGIMVFSLMPQIANGTATAKNIQIEEGTVATTYEPYGEVLHTPGPTLAGLLDGCTFEDVYFEDTDAHYIRSSPIDIPEAGNYTIALKLKDNSKFSSLEISDADWSMNYPPLAYYSSINETQHVNAAQNQRIFLTKSKGLTIDDILSATIEKGDSAVAPPHVEIQSETTVIVTGKNLFDGEEVIRKFYADEYEVLNSYATTSIKLKPNTTYTMKINGKKNGKSLFISVNRQVNSGTEKSLAIYENKYWTKTELTVTTDETGNLYCGMYPIGNRTQLREQLSIALFQVEEGTTASPYEPYVKHIYDVNDDGTVDDIKSISPSMFITTNNDSISVTSKYLTNDDPELCQKYFELKEALQAARDII